MEDNDIDFKEDGDVSLLEGSTPIGNFEKNNSGKWVFRVTHGYSVFCLMISIFGVIFSSIFFLVCFFLVFGTKDFSQLFLLGGTAIGAVMIAVSIFEFCVAIVHTVNGIIGFVMNRSKYKYKFKKGMRVSKVLFLTSSMMNLARSISSFACGFVLCVVFSLSMVMLIFGAVFPDLLVIGGVLSIVSLAVLCLFCYWAILATLLGIFSLRLTLQHIQLNRETKNSSDIVTGIDEDFDMNLGELSLDNVFDDVNMRDMDENFNEDEVGEV